jgi:hypothetical protein
MIVRCGDEYMEILSVPEQIQRCLVSITVKRISIEILDDTKFDQINL